MGTQGETTIYGQLESVCVGWNNGEGAVRTEQRRGKPGTRMPRPVGFTEHLYMGRIEQNVCKYIIQWV